MDRMKKGQGLTLNTIIIVAIVLIVLVILVLIFTGRIGLFREECGGMSISDARIIALDSECGDYKLTNVKYCHDSKWGIELDVGDSPVPCDGIPVCIIDTEKETADIDWRCVPTTEPEPIGPDTEVYPPPEEGMTPEECKAQGGRPLNIFGDNQCCYDDEKNAGSIKGLDYPSICCVKVEFENLTGEQARDIAENSECGEKGTVIGMDGNYNSCSKTWWIDLNVDDEFKKEYCNPACVVDVIEQTAEINWRCMGALSPGKQCEEDSECVVFGEDGDCNCGCFNKDYDWVKEGDCFCLAPLSCKCGVNKVCEDVFS